MQACDAPRPEAGPARTPASRLILLLLALGILAGVLARTYRIDAPLYEYRHYRPMDTAALARNFYEGRMNILYPQVDWRGASSGYAEAEFQAYAFSVATLYRLFGEHLWIGRALNIAAYVASASILFCLVRRLFGELAGLGAVAVYSVAPLAFFFSRTYQADALIALGVLAGIWFMLLWTEDTRRWWALLASAAGVALAALIKPPSLYVGLPLVWMCQRRFGWRFLARPVLWLYALFVLVTPVLWYTWSLSLWDVHGNTFGVLGKHTVLAFWGPLDRRWLTLGERLAERLADRQCTPPGLVLLALGLLGSLRLRRGKLLWIWLLGFVVYIVLVPRGNNGHDYYQLQLSFILAAFMGLGAAMLWQGSALGRREVGLAAIAALACNAWLLYWLLAPSRHPLSRPQMLVLGSGIILLGAVWIWRRQLLGRATLTVIAAGMLIGSTWVLRNMMRPRQHLFERQAFAERVQALTEPEALVIFAIVREWDPPSPENYRHRTEQGEMLYSDPRDFFLSRRKGYSIDDLQATPEFIEELRRRGARYFATAEAFEPVQPAGGPGVFDRHPELEPALRARYRPLEVTDRWAIFELTPPG